MLEAYSPHARLQSAACFVQSKLRGAEVANSLVTCAQPRHRRLQSSCAAPSSHRREAKRVGEGACIRERCGTTFDSILWSVMCACCVVWR
ncbi:hypothetical protein T440DRAFT_211622 [Plenodomus tracheiphilus IPT5]|uniref:Uncharacterized protein n=1 Tax=Plenodomus tracheiphilus IPT5 TaxID=1408161 RepID=A0A6A7AYP6_9PLEO|nr:hypothetical protein T440DRAFT_211622 [Plenodomus tracheiphilus IPT5]